MTKKHDRNQILEWFAVGDHLPRGLPREVMISFQRQAEQLDSVVPDGPEKSAGLRKLLEAKDCMIRASIPPKRRGGPIA